MRHWLFKSEPDSYSIEDLRRDGSTFWDGVRNYQARNHMRSMQPGDLGFFYHSQKGREVVGVVEVTAACHPDSTSDDPRWDCVDVRALRPFARPVTLDAIRADPDLAEMVLVRNSRLSVQPVTPEEWHGICALGGTEP